MAAADVSQVSVLVVVEADGPVSFHGSEVVVMKFQTVNPDGARMHPTKQQLPVGATTSPRKSTLNATLNR